MLLCDNSQNGKFTNADRANPSFSHQYPIKWRVKVNKWGFLCDPIYGYICSCWEGNDDTNMQQQTWEMEGLKHTLCKPQNKTTGAAADIKHPLFLSLHIPVTENADWLVCCMQSHEWHTFNRSNTDSTHQCSHVVPLLGIGLKGTEFSPDLGKIPLVLH